MSPQQALELADGLFAHYPSVRPTELMRAAYASALEAMDREVAQAAIIRLTRTSKWCPSVAELCAAVVANVRGERRSGEEAYAELMAAVRRYGRSYGEGAPQFADPLIERCIGVWGSWNDLCNSPENDPSGRMRFVQLYDQLAARGDRDLVLPPGMRRHRELEQGQRERDKRRERMPRRLGQ